MLIAPAQHNMTELVALAPVERQPEKSMVAMSPENKTVIGATEVF